MTELSLDVIEHVAVITFANPPVNGLSHSLRCAMVDALDRANADPAVDAILIRGAGELFSGGADIKEFNTPKLFSEPSLLTVIDVVEASPKPVIALLHGTCMGGGLELALGCHYRLATTTAQVGLPEVKIGLLPGGVGTQRLPRAIGLEAAMNMIDSGAAVPAKLFAGSALIAELIDAPDPLPAALAFASRIATTRPLPRLAELKVKHPQAEAFIGFVRNSVRAAAGPFPAPMRCLECVQAAVDKPFAEGIALERRLFAELLVGSESKALRHFFFGERAASKIADVPESTPIRDIRTVGVIGAGLMGGGISMNFLNAGIPVRILEVNPEAMERGVGAIRRNYEGQLKKGKLTAATLAQRMDLLKPTIEYSDLRDCDLIVEAVYEDFAVKEAVFRKLDEIAKPGAILASNTSTLDVNRIAGFTSRPGDVVGLHFFSPANIMRLLEVVRGAATSKDVLATAMRLAKRIKKIAVVAGVCDGFIGNRMIEQYLRQATFLLDEGASLTQIDRAIEEFGFAMGPFRTSDLAGNDIGWAIRKRRTVEQPQITYSKVADKLCEMGRFGQKTAKGWYRYEAGARDPLPDPEVDQLIDAHRQSIGQTPRSIPDAEIVSRLVLALVNEGAHILTEGVAARASDIDMVYVTGYGFPLHRGGPMLYADSLGLYSVARTMRSFAARGGPDAAFWQPAALIEALAAEERGFCG